MMLPLHFPSAFQHVQAIWDDPHANILNGFHLASFPGQKRRRRKSWFQPFMHALNRGGIQPPPHTIDIPPYAHDASIDTKQ